MSEWRLFDPAKPPAHTTPEWYAGREAAPHLEQEGHRQRLLATAELVESVYRPGMMICDLGAGDGGLLSILTAPPIDKWGYDLQQTNVKAAKARGVNVILRDVVAERFEVGRITIACEFLEHLIDPHHMVRRIAMHGSDWLIASSPYTEDDVHHYEHHTWAWDRVGYVDLLQDNGWRVVAQRCAWISQIVLARRA